MSIENDVIEDVVDVVDITPTVDEDGNDTTDWKAIAEMHRDLALKNRGIAQRFKTKLEKAKEKSDTPVEKNEEKTVTSDLGERAFLAVNGIKSADEVEFFNKIKKETGKNAIDLIDSTYFQIEFNNFKEKKTTREATPNSSKRSTPLSADSVEYWIAKDELPPANQVELRRQVINTKAKKDSSGGPFYNS